MAKLTNIVEFKGLLKVGKSGLRIGGSKDAGVEIGGTDNPIIRNPMSNRPYVPGSSIKGKIRSLLEQKLQQYQQSGKPCDCGTCVVCRLFGCHDIRKSKSPTRLILRDAQATNKTIEMWDNAGTDSEVKTEVIVNRRDQSANPRTCERIPSGSEFEFAFSVREFDGDNRSEIYGTLADGFDLLEKDYLGGYGSRGYGEVIFVTEDGTRMADLLRKKAK